jgi:hypothetical protein
VDNPERENTMDFVRPAAVLIAAGLLAACAQDPEQTLSADPEAAVNDTVFDETTADDPMDPGAIDDAIGTGIPGPG